MIVLHVMYVDVYTFRPDPVISRQSRKGLPVQQSVSRARPYSACTDARSMWRVLCISFCSVNIGCGRAEERFLLTGLHAVADIFCSSCKTTLGWKYVSCCSPMPSTASPCQLATTYVAAVHMMVDMSTSVM